MAWISPCSTASKASRSTLMPGRNRSRAARRTIASPNRRASQDRLHRARIAVPSTATPLVRMMTSPGRWLSLRTSFDFSTSPSIWPTTIGRPRPPVISVWPPQSVTPRARQARRMSSKMVRASRAVAWPSGSSSVARNQRGRAPSVAMSLALMLTAYQPMRWAVKVIGSLLATRYFPPNSMTAASSPKRGPTTTPDDRGMRQDFSSASRTREGSLPTGNMPGGAIARRV
mgnify:CR=1 FL=1